MKAILEFNLDDKDDKEAHLRCVKSLDMAILLFELANNKKRELFADGDTTSVASYNNGVESVFEKIHEMIEDYGIILDELVS